MMDKRTLIAFGLIAAIFISWSIFFTPEPTPPVAKDSTATPQAPIATTPTPTPPKPPTLDPALAHLTQGTGRYITIQTPLYKAIINTRGGLLARLQLNDYKTWYGAPVQLINDSAGFPGVLGLDIKNRGGQTISTENMVFSVEGGDSIGLKENDSVTIVARLTFSRSQDAPGADTTGTDTTDAAPRTADTAQPIIEKRFTFKGNSYGIGLDVAMKNMVPEKSPAGAGYTLTWKRGVKYQEHNSVDESSKAKALSVSNDDIVEMDASEVGKLLTEKFTGPIDWVGTQSKYFGAAIIPAKPIGGSSAEISGYAIGADSSGMVESYDLALNVPEAASASQRYTIFVGPLAYNVTSDFGVEAMVDLGSRMIIRPIGEFFMLPIFRFLHSFIGNYGVVIIVFSLLIRLLLWPLSIPQIRSSRKMQLLQPKVTEARERFKDDPQKQQMETMALYREYGVNPVSGCLPMVLQLPILYALWGTLSSAIDLRQASFMLWIHDLSIPDQVAQLPFSIPLLGDKLSGLALIMGATLFIQQKMMITDPRQKAMLYFMPVLLTLTFNHLPSGLNLYYLTFNLLSIGQQIYMTKYSRNTLTLEQMKTEAKGKKKGWLAQKMEEAQKMAEMQGKVPARPGDKKVDGRTPVEPRKRK